ncbi:MAG: GEVED domain-containing protein [Weeksellaceae bacterium]|nr:GEVED domain-containing protein [Weeksellaceae bacterium]
MKKFLLVMCLPVLTWAQEGCLTGDMWPSSAFTPICDNTVQHITTGGWAGEYSAVSVIEGEVYEFTSSVESDFITLADADGSVVYATGTGSVSWTATATEDLRFYTHLNSNCEGQSQDRARSVKCGAEPTVAPDCPTLVGPEDGADDIDYTGNVTLSWSAPETGGLVSAYNVYIDTTDGTTFIGAAGGSDTWATISGLSEDTTYYWSIRAVNVAGESVDCAVYSFTTTSNPFPPYCGPLTFTYLTEPITRVAFAGFDNVSAASGSSTVPHENFIDIVGNVTPGETYPITFEGNTEGAHNNYFAVFIDWNQNGSFEDEGEQYFVDGSVSIFQSNGMDGVSATAEITVPEDALPGMTRMRVKKDYGNFQTPANFDDPCFGGLYGQIEDYSLDVSSLSVDDINALNAVAVYPNPTKDVLHVRSMDVRNAKLYDMSGKQLNVRRMGDTIDTRDLLPGVYVLQITDADGNVVNKRFIKK